MAVKGFGWDHAPGPRLPHASGPVSLARWRP